MAHFVYLKNHTADELIVKLELKLWSIFPRTVCQSISAHSTVFVPSEVQKKPFLMEILRDKQSLHTMEVNGYCELTVKAIENDDNSIRQYSVTVRLPDQDVAKSKTENTTLLQIMQMQNYYDILQVDRTADDKTIRRAYHRLAQRFHPDKNSSSLESTIQFQRISDAYAMLCEQTIRNRYNRYLDHQSGIFSKTFWNLLIHDKDRLGLFVGSTLAILGGIVGITLSAGIAAPAIAIAIGCACGGVIGAGAGLLKCDFSLDTAMNGLSWKKMLTSATPNILAGSIAGGLTVGLGPFITSGFEMVFSAPAIVSLTSATCQYVLYQTAYIAVEGVVGDRWEGYNATEVAIDVGGNVLLSVALGASLGMLAEYASLMTVEELTFAAMTSVEIAAETITSAEEERLKFNRNINRYKQIKDAPLMLEYTGLADFEHKVNKLAEQNNSYGADCNRDVSRAINYLPTVNYCLEAKCDCRIKCVACISRAVNLSSSIEHHRKDEEENGRQENSLITKIQHIEGMPDLHA